MGNPLIKMKLEMKKLTNHILGYYGLEVHRKFQDHQKFDIRYSLSGALEQAKKIGFKPETVIDVGAAVGTHALYEAFPNAKHLLIEPLEEFKPYLDKLAKQLKNVEIIIAAAAGESGSTTINVHPDLFGSSTYQECEDSNVNGFPRTIPCVVLDEVCKKNGLHGPYLIKLDVQGAESDVLTGASQILKETECIILEVSLLGFFVTGPQFYDVIAFMKERGFVVYDILDYVYRPLDGAMSQVDLVFVKEQGRFRKHHFYATKEQREAQDEQFQKNLLKF